MKLPLNIPNGLVLSEHSSHLYVIKNAEGHIKTTIGEQKDGSFSWKNNVDRNAAIASNTATEGAGIACLETAALYAINALIRMNEAPPMPADEEKEKFELVISGFTSMAQMKTFWSWYEESGEQDVSDWLEIDDSAGVSSLDTTGGTFELVRENLRQLHGRVWPR